jgi:type I restriction enzyme S subunit
MKHKWDFKKLSSVCDKIGDGLHGTPTYSSDGNYYFVNGNNLKCGRITITNETKKVGQDEFNAHKVALSESTLLLSINGTLGEMALYRGESVVLGKSAAYINCRDVDRRFCFYYFQLKGVQQAFYNIATGSTIKNLGLDSLKNFQIPVPPRDIQKKIAGVLSALDAKIELNQRLNEELEGMAKLLYDYWFAQYDFPMSAAQAAALGKPKLHGHPYRTSGGPMTYNETLKREIPVGWEVKELSELVEVTKDTINPSDEPETSFNLFSIPVFDQTGSHSVDTGSEIGSNKFVVTGNDLLVSKLNPWTSRVIYTDADIEALCSTEFVVWQTTSSWQKAFLYMVARNPQFITYCSKSATGTSNSHKRVNPNVMMSHTVPWEPSVIKAYGDMVHPMLLARQTNQKQTQELTALRDWLLPMLMNGQVTVG